MGIFITAIGRTPPHVRMLGPDQSSPRSNTLFLEDSLRLSSRLLPGLPSSFFSSGFPNETHYSFLLSPILLHFKEHFTTNTTALLWFSILLYSVAQLSLLEGAYRVLERKPEGKRLLGTPRYR